MHPYFPQFGQIQKVARAKLEIFFYISKIYKDLWQYKPDTIGQKSYFAMMVKASAKIGIKVFQLNSE